MHFNDTLATHPPPRQQAAAQNWALRKNVLYLPIILVLLTSPSDTLHDTDAGRGTVLYARIFNFIYAFRSTFVCFNIKFLCFVLTSLLEKSNLHFSFVRNATASMAATVRRKRAEDTLNAHNIENRRWYK